MSNVVSINSNRLSFLETYPQAATPAPGGLKFWTGITLTLCLPALTFSYVIGQTFPLFVMICTAALGFLLGKWMHRHPPEAPISCVPIYSPTTAAPQSYLPRMKDAA